jgi:hypothetical protein
MSKKTKFAAIIMALLLLTITIQINPNLNAQSFSYSLTPEQAAQFANDAPSTASITATEQVGGIYLPSMGTLRILVVFVEFKGDTTDRLNSQWPYGSAPVYMNTVIDSTATQNSVDPNNLTYFFRQMSHELFYVIGKALYVQTPDSIAKYIRDGRSRRYINEQVLSYVDTQIDFTLYDNWSRSSAYTHQNIPDGIVDYIMMCYRTDARNWGPGEASLGYESNNYLTVDNAKRIYFGYPGNWYYNLGSGSTNTSLVKGFPYWWDIPKHEFGHWLLGGNEAHNYKAGLWSLMNWHYQAASTMLNSYERMRLGWLTFTEAGDNIAAIADYMTQHVAYRITMPNTNPQEYLLIENHRLLSPLDVVDQNGGAGLYVIHQKGVATANNLKVLPADGRWNWSNPCWIPHPYGGTGEIPVYKRLTSSRFSGLTDKDEIPNTRGGNVIIEAYIDPLTNQQVIAPLYKKDGDDGFSLQNNNVFTPWSNPAAATWSGTQSTVGFHILSEANNIVNVKFYTSGANAAPPSKPQDVNIQIQSGNGDFYPKITWSAMLEPDVVSGGFIEIQRSIKDHRLAHPTWSAWSTRATLSGNSISYTDQDITTGGMGYDSVKYRIRAKDSQGLYSLYSDEVKTNYSTNLLKEGKFENTAEVLIIPKEYSLSQNYPNPFNPSTQIRFQLPEDAFVVLKVYDALGREVNVLVEGQYSAGYHSVTFNGGALSSGIYFAKINVTNPNGVMIYQQTNKLLLTK